MLFTTLVVGLILTLANGAKMLEGQSTCQIDSNSFTIDIQIDPVTSNKATITLKGASNLDYFAIALKAQKMNENGFLLAGGSTNKWTQMGRVTGYIMPTTAVWNGCAASSTVLNGKRLLTFICALTGDYTFPTAAGSINFICTLGDNTKTPGNGLRQHAGGKRLSSSITIAEKGAKSPQILEGQATCTVDSDSFIIDMKIDPVSTNKSTILLKGPNTKDYFAVALNALKMNENGFLLAGGSTNSWTQIGRVTGYIMPTSAVWNGCTKSTRVIGSDRLITFSCDLTGDYTFPTEAGSINFICTLGDNTGAVGAALRQHAGGKRASGSLTLNVQGQKVQSSAPTKVTPGPTLVPSKNPIVAQKGTSTLVGQATCKAGSESFTIDMTVDPAAKATIKLTGPKDKDYFAIGLNAQAMQDGGWLLAGGSTNDWRQIGKVTAYAKPSSTVWNNCAGASTITNNQRVITFTCDLTGDYAIPQVKSTINFICSLGDSSQTASTAIRQHTPTSRTKGSISLAIAGQTSAPTPLTKDPTRVPTKNPIKKTTNDNCDRDLFGVDVQTFSNPSMGVGIKINCKQNRVEFTLVGAESSWLGIVFGTGMAAPGNNFAAIFEVKDGKEICSEYRISAQNAQGVVFKQPMTIESNTKSGGQRTIVCSLDLSLTTTFTLTTGDVTFLYALGTSTTLAYHGPGGANKNQNTFNLQTGGTSTSEVGGWFTAHGVFMWLSWSFFGYFGIFASRNRHIFPTGPTWFKIHRGCQIACVVASLIGLIMVMAGRGASSRPVLTGIDGHEVMGLLVLIFGFLQPLNAFFRPHNPAAGQEKPLTRRVWEYFHKSFGYICLIVGQFVAYLGFAVKLAVPTLATLHIVWMVLIFLAFIIVWIIGCRKEPEQPKGATANIDENDMGTKDTDAGL